MNNLPDLVQSIGIATSAIIAAMVGWQAKRVKELQTRVAALEEQQKHDQSRFRDAIRFIRQLLGHIQELTVIVTRETPSAESPKPPIIPDSIRDEV